MNINDERDVTVKQVGELPCGAVFESACKIFYMRTENLMNLHVTCVNLANGGFKHFETTSMVRPVEASMTIEDYER